MVKKIAVAFVFILFFLKSFYMLDPDFGWHIKMGELILRSGIPATDPFSYTMPSFPFVDHEWGTNVLMHVLYKYFGWGVLSLIFSTIVLLAILIPLKFNFKKLFLFPFILASGSLLFFVGIRPQIIAWLFFGVLITAFLENKYYEKFRFALPIFFLMFANLHGGFSVGIAIYALFLIVKIYKDKKIRFSDVFLFVLSVFSTLLNPYGIRLWGEVFMQLSDGSLRWNIQEWKPAIFSFYPSLWLLFSFSAALIIMFRKKYTLFEKSLFLCLLIAGLSSIRHMALWAIAATPLLFKGTAFLEEKASKIKYGKERFGKAYKFSVFIALIFLLIPVLSSRENPFLLNERNFYPEKAVGYLQKHKTPGNLFAYYGWGGYLIWKYPEKKLFIDGRMPSWRWDKNPPEESSYAFREYLDLSKADSKIQTTFQKYNIDLVLLPAPKKKQDNFDKFLIWLVEKVDNNKNVSIYSKLENLGWKAVYKDETAVIYRKK